jgi:tetratricopeptide (TPR) repeat protein
MNEIQLRKRLLQIERELKKSEKNETYQTSTKNPRFVDHFASSHGINPFLSLFETKDSCNYLDLRKKQNESSAFRITVSGIELARKKEFKEALKQYDKALEIDKECVEAYVARGGNHYIK